MLLFANSEQELLNLLQTYPKALLFFSATWCQPCKQMTPIIQRLQIEDPRLTIIKIDIEKCLDTVKAEHIMSVPSFCKWGNSVKGPILAGTQTVESLLKLMYQL